MFFTRVQLYIYIYIVIIIIIIIIIVSENTWENENIKKGPRDLKRTENALVILGCLLQLDLRGLIKNGNPTPQIYA